MQLHHLEMTAIGPYAGTERIDFSTIGRAGLFLLEGPTGSGKSTIIDAITFALYGKVAQASADVERIHSHHADPRTVPVVTLVFETQSGIYRVQRTPRFERPKSRGAGTTVAQPTIKLWRVATPDDLLGGELLSTSIGDCDDEITRAVGLTRDQFVQTVILPQGEFATFLRARSEDKGKLLEKVFGTAFFRRVQDEIVEAGRAAQARRQSAVDEIRMAVQAFAVSAGLDTERRDTLVELSRSAPETLAGELAQVVDELATRERHAGKRSREAIDAHRQMADMVGDARLRMQRRERLLALQREDETLGKRAVHFSELRAEVERARQAKPVVGAMRTLAMSEAALKRAEGQLKAARSRIEATLRDAPLETLRANATRTREVIGSLTGAITLETALAGRVTEADRRRAELDRSREALASTGLELAALPEAITAHERALTEARGVHALLESRTVEATRAKTVLEAAVAHDAALARVPGVEQATIQALDAVRSAELELARLRQARIDDIAGELGLALAEGEPCPVCGSLEHPSPARPTPDAVTPERVLEELKAERGGDAVRLRTAAQTAARLGRAEGDSADLTGGAILPADLRVNPREAAPALARWVAEQPAGDVRWGTAVTGVEPGTVHTTRGPVHGDRILICVGHDLDYLLPDIAEDHEVQRCRLTMARAEAPAGFRTDSAVLTATSMLRYDAFTGRPSAARLREEVTGHSADLLGIGANVMFTRLPDGTVLVGDSHHYDATTPPFVDERTHELLTAAVARVLGVERLRVLERWQGVYASSPRGPLLVRDPAPGVRVLTVTSGIGMTLSFGLAAATFDGTLAPTA